MSASENEVHSKPEPLESSPNFDENPHQFDADLIEVIKTYPCIYNNKTKNKNQENIDEAWKRIADNLQSTSNFVIITF